MDKCNISLGGAENWKGKVHFSRVNNPAVVSFRKDVYRHFFIPDDHFRKYGPVTMYNSGYERYER